MGDAHRYWVIPDTDAAIGAAMRAAGPGIVPGGLATAQGAAGDLALVKVRAEACGAPPEGVVCRDLAAWTAYQSGPAWVRHEPQEWTGTEKAVLVPVAEGTPEHVAHLAAGWAACEFIAPGSRLVRYTGDVPDALAAYTQLTAEEVVSLAATEVR